jgi:acetoin utilization deacetylase AcuC-like enzyme
MVREAVIAEGVVQPAFMHDPERISLDDLLLVHSADYIDRFTEGTLSPDEERRLGFPWSAALVERAYRAAGGTNEAARGALEHGIAMNLAGGTHHAFPSHGEGFCVFNDIAVAIRSLQRDDMIERAAIIDLDVHQGNGTHAIFAGDERVFTFSMHGSRNYPFKRKPGTLDVDLPDGTDDEIFLEKLTTLLPRVLADASADLVCYLAGADPHENDRLGRLKMTISGLARRDRLVIESCREVGIPIVITIAGGYGRDINDTVRIHVNTARIASEFA